MDSTSEQIAEFLNRIRSAARCIVARNRGNNEKIEASIKQLRSAASNELRISNTSINLRINKLLHLEVEYAKSTT